VSTVQPAESSRRAEPAAGSRLQVLLCISKATVGARAVEQTVRQALTALMGRGAGGRLDCRAGIIPGPEWAMMAAAGPRVPPLLMIEFGTIARARRVAGNLYILNAEGAGSWTVRRMRT
jgi:hypothetical protein